MYHFYAYDYPETKKTENTHPKLVKDMEAFERRLDETLTAAISKGHTYNLREVVKETLRPFFDKYNAPSSVREESLTHKISELKNIDRSAFLSKIRGARTFYSILAGESAGPEHTLSVGDENCLGGKGNIMRYGKALASLVHHAQKMSIPLAQLMDEGKLRANKEILQLALAPKCVAPSNRKKVSDQIFCAENGITTRQRNMGSQKTNMPFIRSYKA